MWLVSLALKNSSIVDIFWGTGFVISAWTAFALTPEGFAGRKWLLVVLTSIWGLRLTLHILTRNWSKGEDFRYQVWRKEAGAAWWWRSFFKVFLLQGILMWIISDPPAESADQRDAGADDLAWITWRSRSGWWASSSRQSATGSWRSSRRTRPTKAKCLTRGVWRYTRHPNYFGDAAQWWAFLPDRAGGRRLVDHLQPGVDDAVADARLGRDAARKDAER